MIEHTITKCSTCKTVISQCRCPMKDKHIDWVICDKCQKIECMACSLEEYSEHTCGAGGGTGPRKEKCHEHDLVLVGAITNTHLCLKCEKHLAASEVEILNQYYEIGSFCDNEECERYLLLVV